MKKEIFNKLSKILPDWLRQIFRREKKVGGFPEKIIAWLNLRYPNVGLRIVDVGARFGPETSEIGRLLKWKNVELFGIEPDEEAAKAIENRVNTPKYNKIYRKAVWSGDIQTPLNITAYQGCSSLLEPNMEELKGYAIRGLFEVRSQVPVTAVGMDQLLVDVRPPHVIKIDVQGGEYHVLQGAKNLLVNCLCLIIEAHLRPIYHSEKSFGEINTFLQSSGWRLIQMSDAGSFDGEILEINCVYVKTPELVTEKKDFTRLIIISACFGNSAYVEFLLRNYGNKWFPYEINELWAASTLTQKNIQRVRNGDSVSEYGLASP